MEIQNKIYLVIPTYNELDNIKDLLLTIFNLKLNNLHVIVVDDNSPDGTYKIVNDLINHNFNLKLIKRKKKMGIGSAYVLGFNLAVAEGANLILQMDADFSHDPEEIPNFIKAIENGAQVVIGSRYIAGGAIVNWGRLRKFMSKTAIYFSRVMLKFKTHDITSGFRCYKKEVISRLNLGDIKSNGYAFQEELLYRCEQNNFKIVEIPIKFIDRSYGRSKLSVLEIIKFFLTIFRLKFKR